jgi:hypothetical protein
MVLPLIEVGVLKLDEVVYFLAYGGKILVFLKVRFTHDI